MLIYVYSWEDVNHILNRERIVTQCGFPFWRKICALSGITASRRVEQNAGCGLAGTGVAPSVPLSGYACISVDCARLRAEAISKKLCLMARHRQPKVVELSLPARENCSASP